MNKETATKWLKQAIHDLEMARKNIDIEGYDIAAFLAHQSVEKLLKAVYAIQGKKIPKTHYIDEMARELNLDSKTVDMVTELAIDYTFARYPDIADHVPYEEYDKEIALEKVEFARKVLDSLKEFYSDILEEHSD